MMDFSHRSTVLELMDDPLMDASKYREAYADINNCNKLLGGYNITINAVLALLSKNEKESYTILDMGCGDGEMLRKLSKALRKKGIIAKLIGIDLRDDVLAIAKDNSEGYPDIEFVKQDILTLEATFDCDVLLCTLTMHHFTDQQIAVFTKKFVELAKLGAVINDLERSWLSYQLFKVFSAIIIKTSIAKTDGLISISKGFRRKELWNYAQKLKNASHSITWKWAFRYVWIMKPNRLN